MSTLRHPRLKDIPAGDALHALIKEGVAMEEPWKALRTKELSGYGAEPPAEDDAIPGAGPEAVDEAWLDPVRALKIEKPTHRATIHVGTLRDGGNAINYEVAVVANADQAEPIALSWTSPDVAFETLEQAQIAAAQELTRWALKLKDDSPAKSPLRTQAQDIAEWAQVQFNQVREMQEAASA